MKKEDTTMELPSMINVILCILIFIFMCCVTTLFIYLTTNLNSIVFIIYKVNPKYLNFNFSKSNILSFYLMILKWPRSYPIIIESCINHRLLINFYILILQKSTLPTFFVEIFNSKSLNLAHLHNYHIKLVPKNIESYINHYIFAKHQLVLSSLENGFIQHIPSFDNCFNLITTIFPDEHKILT